MTATKVKTITTTLDVIPDGANCAGFTKEKSNRLPAGVSRKGLLKDIVLIAWPSLVELVLTQLTSMADQVMVGRLPGEAGIIALSAVGLAAQPKFLLMTMIQAMNVGSTAVIARYRGQKNREKAKQAFHQTLFLNLIIGIVVMLAGLALSPALINVMSGNGVGQETLDRAVEYLNIQLYGFLPLTLSLTVTAALRGIGDSRTPMIYNTIANVVNLILNYVMIYGKFGCPAMGVAGAAWATIIGQSIAFVIAIAMVLNPGHYMNLNLRMFFQFDKLLMKSIIGIGIPAMIEQLFMRAGMIIFTRAIASLGDTIYATHQICMSIQALSFMMGQAFATATTTLMGQSLGKRRNDMSMIYMQHARGLGCIVSLLLAGIIIVFNRGIVGVYNSNESVIEFGSQILILIAASQPVQMTQFIVSGGLRGAGDTKYTAFVMMITTLVVRSILVVLMVSVFNWGLWGAWIALIADQCLRTVLMVARYNTGKWMYLWNNRPVSQ